MTCPVCRREEYGEDCGPRGNTPCPCCDMVIIAEAGDEREEDSTGVELTELVESWEEDEQK